MGYSLHESPFPQRPWNGPGALGGVGGGQQKPVQLFGKGKLALDRDAGQSYHPRVAPLAQHEVDVVEQHMLLPLPSSLLLLPLPPTLLLVVLLRWVVEVAEDQVLAD